MIFNPLCIVTFFTGTPITHWELWNHRSWRSSSNWFLIKRTDGFIGWLVTTANHLGFGACANISVIHLQLTKESKQLLMFRHLLSKTQSSKKSYWSFSIIGLYFTYFSFSDTLEIITTNSIFSFFKWHITKFMFTATTNLATSAFVQDISWRQIKENYENYNSTEKSLKCLIYRAKNGQKWSKFK